VGIGQTRSVIKRPSTPFHVGLDQSSTHEDRAGKVGWDRAVRIRQDLHTDRLRWSVALWSRRERKPHVARLAITRDRLVLTACHVRGVSHPREAGAEQGACSVEGNISNRDRDRTVTSGVVHLCLFPRDLPSSLARKAESSDSYVQLVP
jgi:hypothetical protein